MCGLCDMCDNFSLTGLLIYWHTSVKTSLYEETISSPRQGCCNSIQCF